VHKPTFVEHGNLLLTVIHCSRAGESAKSESFAINGLADFHPGN